MGTEDHKDITEVLTAVYAIECVQPPIPEALIEEVATPASPSTSTTPVGCQSRLPVATPRLVCLLGLELVFPSPVVVN